MHNGKVAKDLESPHYTVLELNCFMEKTRFFVLPFSSFRREELLRLEQMKRNL